MPFPSITLAAARIMLQAKYEGVPFWTGDEARRALNEALRFWSILTQQWRERIVLPFPADAHWLIPPGPITSPLRMEWQEYPMELSSLADLDHARIDWETEHTASGGDVPTRPTLFALAQTYLAVWPADHTGLGGYTLDGIRRTPQLVKEADTVDLGQAEFVALLGFALLVLSFKQGIPAIQAAIPGFQGFLRAAAEKNSRLTASSTYRRWIGHDFLSGQIPMGLEGDDEPVEVGGAGGRAEKAGAA